MRYAIEIFEWLDDTGDNNRGLGVSYVVDTAENGWRDRMPGSEELAAVIKNHGTGEGPDREGLSGAPAVEALLDRVGVAHCATCICGKRAPVQYNTRLKKGAGTVAWWEHLEAWAEYARRYGHGQSAERLAERGGFCFGELTDFLGHEPTTWSPRR